jgi:deoxyribodipyrimidine photolyase
MDQIFRRLNTLFKSQFAIDDDDDIFEEKSSYFDEDEKAAWEELNDFLNQDFKTSRTSSSSTSYTSSDIPMELYPHFQTLEVSPGTSFTEVKKAYKEMVKKHHPDQFMQDPEKHQSATKKMKKINGAFRELAKYYKSKAV